MRSLPKKNMLFCLVGPSGSGKTTFGKRLLSEYSGSIRQSVSATTREMRAGEQNGVDYSFLTKEVFEKEVREGLFFEWEEYGGQLYGTRRKNIEQALSGGEDLLLVIDIRGALHCKEVFPDETLIVFLLPPSPEHMQKRLEGRGQMPEAEKEQRFLRMKAEVRLFFEECRKSEPSSRIDYLLVNEDLEETYDSVRAIYSAERNRTSRIHLAQEHAWVASWLK